MSWTAVAMASMLMWRCIIASDWAFQPCSTCWFWDSHGRNDLGASQAFQAFYHTPAQNISLMHQLMAERQRLAQLMGRRTFTHHVIGSHTLAGSPEAVQSFLDGLADQLKPLVRPHLPNASVSLACHAGDPMPGAQKPACCNDVSMPDSRAICRCTFSSPACQSVH